ncbi:hypothetical protein [Pseudoalteromonas sp. T1lg88]|uniref:hypothetical protein n=1 Tax=Pseudoalteromonas sp. T1lg88 TaxID=2077104 RepID=UPI000CF6044C|nr:hypothetical protein [Pseudoalteromonas sp. T1lg88]
MKTFFTSHLAIPFFLIIISLIWLGYSIFTKNIFIKELTFSFVALSAAFFMFTLNSFFNLKEERFTSKINSHILIGEDYFRLYKKEESFDNSNFFALENSNEIFKKVNLDKKINKSLTIEELELRQQKIKYYLIIVIMSDWLQRNSDWEKKKTDFHFTNVINFRNNADNSNDTFIPNSEIDKLLDFKSPNLTLSKNTIKKGLILPPKTKISIDEESIKVTNPFVEIKIEFEVDYNKYLGRISHAGKKFKLIDDLRIPLNQRQSEPSNMQAVTYFSYSFSPFYKGHPKIEDYRKWVNEVHQMLCASLSYQSLDKFDKCS